MVPAFGFPLGCDPLATPTTCTSAIPAYLMGVANVEVKTCHSDSNGDSHDNSHDCSSGSSDNPLSVPMLFESAYPNPFGGPISITSAADASIVIVASYDEAISHWKHVQLGGFVLDDTGTNVGTFAMTSQLTEDLLGATEKDQGTISIVSTSASFPSASGTFKGTSTIPTDVGFSCASTDPKVPLPLPGTCTSTGSISMGTVHLHSIDGKASIKGFYLINWSVPALGFGPPFSPLSSTIMVTVSGNSGDS